MPAPTKRSAPSRRDPALDGLRGVAVLLVFVFHYGGGLHAHNPFARALGYLTQSGWIGVEIFFALSGFLITGILLDSLAAPRALRNFFARRALRILPLYIFALLACAVAALATGGSLRSLQPLAIYAVFLQNLPPLVNAALHTPPPLPVFHLWSLAVEEQFYLLWPFLLLLTRIPRRTRMLCLGVFAATFAIRCAVFLYLPYDRALPWATFLPLRAGALALGGALAAELRIEQNKPFAALGTWNPALPALAVVVLLGVELHSFLLNSAVAFCLLLPAATLLSAGTVSLSLRSPAARRVLALRPLAALGRISYGVYVFHILLQPLFDALAHAATHNSAGFLYQSVRLAVALPLTTVAAVLSFKLLEQPFLRLRAPFPEPSALPPAAQGAG